MARVITDLPDGNWVLKNPSQKELQIGDLYKPWYYTDNTKWASKAIRNVCLLYDVRDEVLDTKQIGVTAFTADCRGKHLYKYYDKQLEDSLRRNGQHSLITCVKHYSVDMPNRVRFLDRSVVDDLRCFEGHHRLITLEKMGLSVRSRNYFLYDLDLNRLDKHYTSTFSDDFWTKFNPPDKRVAKWFTLGHFKDPSKSNKYVHLKKCFEFIRGLGIRLSSGVDVGCAEGVYSVLANQYLGIPITGVELEVGRVLRGLIARLVINNRSVRFIPCAWDSRRALDEISKHDFCMLLSILHHMDNFDDYLDKVLGGKKIALIEARLRPQRHKIGLASMKSIQSVHEFDNYIERSGFNKRLVSKREDRHFYVLWRR